MTPIWGDRPTYVVPPAIRLITEVGRTYLRLPELIYHLWLTSEPIGADWCASELVVLYFGPPQYNIPIGDIVGQALRDIPWEQVARDFDY
jgi:hypothetical protein